MKELKNEPSVSIIVPVYNSEEYLYRCMDSLVYQSFRDIEIIAVNNGSTDSSLDILEKYKKDFPNLVKVITIPHAERAGTGRNVGLKYARAKYIVFSDSDDMMHPRCVEWLYNYIESKNYDFVFSPFVRIKNGVLSIQRQRKYASSDITVERALIDAEPSPWGKIFTRKLLEDAGGFPEEFSFEDLAFFCVYTTHAKKIGYFPAPVYYYFWKTGSEVHSITNPRIAETVKAEEYALQYCLPKYRMTISCLVAQRIVSNLSARWIFADKFIEHLYSNWEDFCKNEKIYKNFPLFNELLKYFKYSSNQSPKRLYLDGFCRNGQIDKQFENATLNAYYDGGEIFILNEHNCNLDKLPVLRQEYDKGNFEYVAGYFALERIYQDGGVYVGRHLKIDLPLNYTRHLNAFFGYEGENRFTDQFFGAKKGENVLTYLLDMYKKNPEKTSLSEYIGNVLLIYFGIHCNGKTNIYGLPITLFAPNVVMCPVFMEFYNDMEIHFCHYVENWDENDCSVVLPKSSFIWLRKHFALDNKKFSSDKELKEIKSSNSYKALVWLKDRKDKGIVRLIYKIYRFVYKKIIN